MTQSRTCQVLVVGGGPGGYPAAIRAGQLGLDTIIVEADRLGGTCLIRGCIPSKAIIHAAGKVEAMTKHANGAGDMGISLNTAPSVDMGKLVEWKEGIVDKLSGGVGGLLKAAKVEAIHGWATFKDAKTCVVETKDGPVEITAQNVILANGSVETELPFMPFDGDVVISSRDALNLQQVPKHFVVVGAGYIGVELGTAFAKLGSKVTFVEMSDAIIPGFDGELTKPVAAWLKKHGVDVHLNAKAKGVGREGNATHLDYDDADGNTQSIQADKILVAVGRKPCVDGWGLDNMGLDRDGPFIKVDDQCRTGMRGVYAIGDLVGEPLLAHKATAQGEMVAEIIAGEKRSFDKRAIAAVCFTEPEIVGVGLSPKEAEAKGEDVIVGRFPMAASGRALSMEAGEDRGFVRVTARK